MGKYSLSDSPSNNEIKVVKIFYLPMISDFSSSVIFTPSVKVVNPFYKYSSNFLISYSKTNLSSKTHLVS